jgi:hypothetical protein
MTPEQLAERTQAVISQYNGLVKGIDLEANTVEDRAYGGVVRAGKGSLVENMTKGLVKIAWDSLGGEPERISFVKKTTKLPIKSGYADGIENEEVKKYIEDNIDSFFYLLKADVHVYIDDVFKIAIECKAYTENAMLKRILVDFTLFKVMYPDLACVLYNLKANWVVIILPEMK